MAYVKQFFGWLMAAYRQFSGQDGPLLAAAIAYYLAFSLFPMMLILVAILGWAFRFTTPGQRAEQRVISTVAEQVSPSLAEQLTAALGSVEKSAAASGVFGSVVLLVTAIALFTQIDYAFDRIWENTASAASGWRQRVVGVVLTRLKAVLMLLGVGAFVMAVMIASIVWQGVQTNIRSAVELGPWFQRIFQPLLHIGLNILAFAVVYRYLPKVRVSWKAAFVGGLLASTLWEIGRQVLAAYVVGDKLPTAYGLIGSFMAIMLWTYYAMMVVLFGAAFTRVLNEDPGLPNARG
ncbi:MAG TPA: YihY/virulence factor BrkB family protein [Lacipirellula sp.]